MREVFFCKEVEASIAALIKDKYPFGTVAVYGNNDAFLTLLKVQNNPYVISPKGELSASIRYVVGFGNDSEINQAKALAVGKKLILCPNKLSLSVMSNYALIGNLIAKVGYPNYIYLQDGLEELYKNDLLQAMIYVHMAALDLMAGEVVVSNILREIFSASRQLILKDSFTNFDIEEGMCIAKKMWDNEACSAIMGAELVSMQSGREQDSCGIIFLIYVLTQFTKCKISGILYGVDRVRIRQLYAFPNGYVGHLGATVPCPPSYEILARFLPNNDMLWRIKTQCKGDCCDSDHIRNNCKKTIDNLLIAMELLPTNGVLTYFAASGFLEGVLNENSS